MCDQRKKFIKFMFILIGIIAIVTIIFTCISEINNLPDNWWGNIVMVVIDSALILLLVVLSCIFVPKYQKIEREMALKRNDFNVSTLNGKDIPNSFDVHFSLITKITFNEKTLTFTKIKLDEYDNPILKSDPSKIDLKNITPNDFITENFDIEYSKLKFYVATNREFYKSVPQIGISIKSPAELDLPEPYIVLDLSKELLVNIYGNDITLINAKLLKESVLEKRPKVLKTFSFVGMKWWAIILFVTIICVIGIGIGLFTKNTIFGTMIACFCCVPLVIGLRIRRLVFYENYISFDKLMFNNCEVVEINEVEIFDTKKNKSLFFIEIITPGCGFTVKHSNKLLSYLKQNFPPEIFNDLEKTDETLY